LEQPLDTAQQGTQMFSGSEAVFEIGKLAAQSRPRGVAKEVSRRRSHTLQDKRDAPEDLRDPSICEGTRDQRNYFPITGIFVVKQELQRIGMYVLAPIVLGVQTIQCL
jgi:hypothetical protein